VATICYKLGIPISWALPSGLTIKQSYLQTESTSIKPFLHSKVKLNIKVTIKGSYDKNHQIRALMPNLIHYLGATSMALLFYDFTNSFVNTSLPQFFFCSWLFWYYMW